MTTINVGGAELVAKKCTRCGKIKVLDDFYNRKRGLGGKHSQCRDCMSTAESRKRRSRVVLLYDGGVPLEAKMCWTCRLIKPLDMYASDDRGVGKRHKDCLECQIVKKEEAIRKSRGIESVLINGKNVDCKKCAKCGELKPLTDYHKRSSTASGLSSRCKVCLNEKTRVWVKNNPQMHIQQMREYYKKNKDKVIQYIARWQRENYEKVKVIQHRRYARKLALPDTLTHTDLSNTLSTFNNSCALSSNIDIHLDHFVALSTGHVGTVYENMTPLSVTLNTSKGNKNPFEWIKSREDIDIDRFNKVVAYLAELNGLTVDEYRQFVYWCYENPRTLEEIKSDPRNSIEIWTNEKEPQ